MAISLLILGVLVVPLGVTYADRQERELLSRIERDAYAVAGVAEQVNSERPLASSRSKPSQGGRVDGDADDQPMSSSPKLAETVNLYHRRTGGRAIVVNAKGICVADSAGTPGQSFANRPEIAEALRGSVVRGVRYSSTADGDLMLVAAPLYSPTGIAGAVRVTFSRSALDNAVRANWMRLGALCVLVLLSVAVAGWTIARWATRPIRDVEGAALALARGDLHARVEPGRGPREVAQLANTFNTMAQQNQELFERQRRFVADASHQLRTPLTALSLRLESVHSAVDDGVAVQAELVDDVTAAEREVTRLGAIVQRLLQLSRAGRGAAAVPVRLLSVMDDRRGAWESLAASEGRPLTVGPTADVVVLASPGAIEDVLDNIVSNAMAHTAPGTAVEVSAVRRDHIVEVVVVDHGAGLIDAEKVQALGRFWRAPGAAAGGSGLGLSIVEALVMDMGGTVTLGDTPGGGLTVCVALPIVVT